MKIKTCKSCDLCLTNKFTPVSGRGNHNSEIIIVGESPGYYERKQGLPFVGKSGKLLQYFIDRYNFTNNTYITNAVKCRPSGNRTPNKIEIEKCNKYLLAELRIIRPEIIILLGNTAIESFYHKFIPISKVSGKITNGKPMVGFLYHPAYILRNNDAVTDYIKVFDKVVDYYRDVVDYSHIVNF